ncbi:MAG: amino acid ABC transporter permease [Candidatus Micrarchaeota archaeon]|nr:amino acid ABC transporter permease [Candidatus Micrarchaeota archaeon]
MFLAGLIVTLLLALSTFACAFVIAIALVVIKKSGNMILGKIADIYSFVFKSIPALVMIIWIYYALPLFLNVALSPFVAALVALSLNLSPFVSESIISGINAIPKGQYESALLLGMNKIQAMRFVVFPQVLKNIMPDLMGWFVTELKFTSLASIIGLNELLHVSNIIISHTFLPFEVYTMLALIYLLFVGAIEIAVKRSKRINYKVLI